MRTMPVGRRQPRKSVDLRCSFRTSQGEIRRPRMRDLSVEGAWLATSRPPAIGERVRLRLTVPGDEAPIVLHAEVMRAQACAGFGVEFLDLDDVTRERLADFLDRCERVPAGELRFEYRDHSAA
jgi:hypothetical protein